MESKDERTVDKKQINQTKTRIGPAEKYQIPSSQFDETLNNLNHIRSVSRITDIT